MAERDPVLDYCQEAIEQGSKSFAGAARLFDAATRESAVLLYAWCRYCDDAVDGERLGRRTGIPGGDVKERLDWLQRTTRAALRGDEPAHPAFAGLQRVVRRHAIPDRYPLELIEGFAMDVAGRSNPEIADLCEYCYHVAGVVGMMMASVMGVREPVALHRASDLGLALQMTNIARDVIEDAQVGRVYLPLAWLAQEGLCAADVLDPARRPALARVVRRLLAEADRYYHSGGRGLAWLPFRSAWAVAAARRVYRAIGRGVLSRGASAWDERVVVPRRRKLALMARAFLDAGYARTLGQRETHRGGLWTRERSAD